MVFDPGLRETLPLIISQHYTRIYLCYDFLSLSLSLLLINPFIENVVLFIFGQGIQDVRLYLKCGLIQQTSFLIS
jgi:hypothetical protein